MTPDSNRAPQDGGTVRATAVTGQDWRATWSALFASLRVVRTPEEQQALIDSLLRPADSARVLGFVNAYALNLAAEKPDFARALGGLDILLRDGSGTKQMFLWARRDAGRNLNGTDFIPLLLRAATGRRVAFWGTEEPWTTQGAAHSTAAWGLDMVSVETGFHPDEFYIDLFSRTQADIVLLGIGMPRQEILAVKLREIAARPVLIICGGAIIDFLGGKVSRAPAWLRDMGLEWTYRLIHEPRRLFRRYVRGIPVFFWRLARWRP